MKRAPLVVGISVWCLSALFGLRAQVVAKVRQYEPRPALEIRAVDITPGLEDVVGHPTHRGAYVVEGKILVHPRSMDIPVDSIRKGDLIIGIGDEAVQSTEDLRRLVSAKKPGDQIKVRVIRKRRESMLSMKLRSAPPLIYLPVETCPTVTADEIAGQEFLGFMFFGSPIYGISPIDVSGRCPLLAQACKPLQLEKQTNWRTLVDINGWTHEIVGNWFAHTHLDEGSCLEEKAKLDSLRRAESR